MNQCAGDQGAASRVSVSYRTGCEPVHIDEPSPSVTHPAGLGLGGGGGWRITACSYRGASSSPAMEEPLKLQATLIQ